MIARILRGRGSAKEKIKRISLYISRKRGAGKAFDKRHSIVFEKHPEFNKPLPKSLKRSHKTIWKPFNNHFDDATLKICRATSGTDDPLIIPEEIFRADIEPSLNRHHEAHYLAHKSFYNRIFEKGLFPDNLLHAVNGEILDSRYQTIDLNRASELAKEFSYPVVVKPNLDSWGGSNVRFIDTPEILISILEKEKDIVVQKRMKQHHELAKYHEPSLNTVRVYLYKSVHDNRVHIVNIVFRMGNGAPVDNVASGGLVSLVREDGRMHGYALDRYGEKFTRHPVSGLPFTGEIPEFGELKRLAAEIARKLFLLRVVGLDLFFDETGKWRAVEINTRGHSIRFAQYAGYPFFGEFTAEVIEYCKQHHWALQS